MDQILQRAVSYTHETLIANLAVLNFWVLVQDPGAIGLVVTDTRGRATGRLMDGRVVNDIPGAVYVPSDSEPAVAVPQRAADPFRVVVYRPRDGRLRPRDFQLP